MSDTMLDRSFRNAYGSARAHSMLQSSCATLPLPASPVLSLRSGIVGGVSLSEVLHYARRTQCFSPPNDTRPHRLITKLSLEASSRHDFVRKAESTSVGENRYSVSVSLTHVSLITAHSARSKRQFAKARKRVVGGSLQTATGRSPVPHKML